MVFHTVIIGPAPFSLATIVLCRDNIIILIKHHSGPYPEPGTKPNEHPLAYRLHQAYWASGSIILEIQKFEPDSNPVIQTGKPYLDLHTALRKIPEPLIKA